MVWGVSPGKIYVCRFAGGLLLETQLSAAATKLAAVAVNAERIHDTSKSMLKAS